MNEPKRERYIRILKSKSHLPFVEFSFDAVKEIIELLEESERKNGKWIQGTNHGLGVYNYTCSECSHTIVADDAYNFCPDCGADMRQREDDNV